MIRPIGLIRPIRLIRPIGLIGLIGLISLISCSKEQLSEPEPQLQDAIRFSGGLQEESDVVAGTRAEGDVSLSDEVETFMVWGYKNMEYENGEYGGLQCVIPTYRVNWINLSAYSTTSNTNSWEYVAQNETGEPEQTIKYWDWDAKAYRFFGVTNWGGTPPKAYGAPNDGNTAYEMTMLADASNDEAVNGTPYYTHLWFSTGNENDYPTRLFGRPVQLVFIKPFAKVRFMFTYSYEAEGIKIKNKVFKPTDESKIACKGTVTVTYPLTGTATTESFSVTDVATGEGSGELDAFTEEYIPEGTEKWYTVLPRSSQGSYTMTVNINGEDKTAVVPAEYMTWLPGYSYTYIFKITEEGGVEIEMVQSAFTPWTEMEQLHSVYNW